MRGPPPARPRAGEPVAVPSASTRRVRGGGGPVSRDAGPNSTPGVPLVARRFAPCAPLAALHGPRPRGRAQATEPVSGAACAGGRFGGAAHPGPPARHSRAWAGGAVFPRLRWFRAPPAWRPRPARRLFLGVGGARGEKPMGENPAHRRRTIRHRTGVSGVAPAGYAAPARPERGSAPDRAARRVLPRAR